MSDPRAKLRRTIFGQCRRLGIDEDQRHEIQVTVCGFESMKDATKDALVKMVEHLVERGAPIDPPKAKRIGTRRPATGAPAKIDRMITVSQRETIESWVGWKNLSAEDVRILSKRICKHDFPQTTRQATALIIALSSNRIPSQAKKTKE